MKLSERLAEKTVSDGWEWPSNCNALRFFPDGRKTMKIIDLLVKELPKIGGWPDKVTHIGQDYDRELMFYGRGNIRTGIILDCLSIDHRPIGRVGAKVTRAQYEAALAKNDGWIEWGGGACPVEAGTMIDVRYRDGKEKTLPALRGVNGREATNPFWRHDNTGTDIMAYRLHRDTNSRANDDRLEQDLNECIGQDVDMPEWSGDGLPPVGCECEVRFGNFSWVPCKVVYRGDAGVAFVYSDNSTIDCVGTGRDDYFRPLRTEPEKAREKLAASLHIAAGASPIELNGIGPLYFKLADAISAGKIPGVKLEVK